MQKAFIEARYARLWRRSVTKIAGSSWSYLRDAANNKLLLAMKLTFFLLTVALMQVSAKGLAQHISLTGKDLALKQVFSAIKKQTGYVVIYNQRYITDAQPVTIDVRAMPLENFLHAVLKDQPVSYRIEGNTISLVPKPVAVMETQPYLELPPGPLRGVVLDENRQPVAGVTVLLKHARNIFVTNDKGEFTFNNAADNDTLMITSINFEPRIVPVSGSFMTITLKASITKLSGVTVFNTGYQVLTKERATGSYGKPDMKTFTERVGTMDIMSRLDGQIPGLTLTVGGPSSSTTSLTGNNFTTRKSVLRGIGTVILNTDPLYVVNGLIVTDFNSVNPDDIEDITVLKDAAATAIWGARAANGVVIVVTKSGKRNQRLTVNYTGFLNYQGNTDFSYKPVLNSQQFIQAAREIFDPVAFPYAPLYNQFVAPHEQILYDQYRGVISAAQANKSLDSLASINNVDQIRDIFYRPAFVTNHTVSASGGNNTYSFYASLGYTGTQSNTVGDKNNVYRINVTQSVNAGSRVKITLNTSLVNNVSGSSNMGSTVDNGFIPYQLFKDASGNGINMPYMLGWGDSLRQNYQARSRINMDYVPVNEMNYTQRTANIMTVNVTGNVSVKLWKGLSFNGTYGYLKAPGTTTSYIDNKSMSWRKQLLSLTVAPAAGSTPVYYLPVTGGTYTVSNNSQRNWTVRNQLVYEGQPRQGRDRISIQAGQEAQEQLATGSSASLLGYDQALNTYAVLDYVTLAKGIQNTVTGFGSYNTTPYRYLESLLRFTSYFALANYTIDEKYSIDLSWRQDHSNFFGNDVSSQNKPIWSLGGKWNIIKEPFMKSSGWINDLAIRATYGIAGNAPSSGSSSYDVMRAVSFSGNSNAIAGDALTINSYSNKKIVWENNATFNLGIDFSVLNRRISGGIDVYQRTITDMLGSVPVNSFTGNTIITGNIGKLVNKGVELSLRTDNVRAGNFNWTSSFVFSYNHNKLVSYTPPSASGNTASSRISNSTLIGYPRNPVFAYRFAGLDNMGDPQIMLANKTITKSPSVAKVEDVVYMGTLQPVFNGGLTNRFSYKGVSLSANMIYSMGSVMRRDLNTSLYNGRLASFSSFTGGNINPIFMDRWKKPGDEAFTNVPSYVSASSANSRRNMQYFTRADINTLSASFIKLRDITLAYELQPQLLEMIKVQRINVFAQATNFMIWKANKYDIDPEYYDALNGIRNTRTFLHTWSLGLNLTF